MARKKLKHRGLAAIISITLLIFVIGGVIFLLSSQIMNLANEVPQLFRKLSFYFEDLRIFIEDELGIPYHEQPSALMTRFSTFIQESLGALGKTLTQTLKVIVLISIMPIYIFFILFLPAALQHLSHTPV